MKIYLKCGRKIRVSSKVAAKIMEEMLGGENPLVTVRQKINNEYVAIFRIDQIAVVK